MYGGSGVVLVHLVLMLMDTRMGGERRHKQIRCIRYLYCLRWSSRRRTHQIELMVVGYSVQTPIVGIEYPSREVELHALGTRLARVHLSRDRAEDAD
jgi:hypothetical protein